MSTTPTVRRRISPAEFRARCADPVVFARKVLALEPWARQAEVMRAIAAHSRVAVRSGHKVGKSTLAVAIALWWVYTRDRGQVVLTSSTDRQVRLILWTELTRLHGSAPVPLGGELALDPATGFRLKRGRRIIGFATDKADNMGGFSGQNLLFIADEASGIPEHIFQAMQGNRAGGARILLLGNPLQPSGTFFDAFHEKRHLWNPLHISSEETPNVTGLGAPVPGLATPEWVAEMAEDWGKDSPLYAVRVRGDFATQGSDVVISLGTIEEARTDVRQREAATDNGVLRIGVDPARFGDDEFVVAPVRGRLALPMRAFRGLDGPNGAGKVLEIVRELRRRGERPRVKIDVIGIGASVFDALKGSDEVESIAVNVAEAATAQAEGQPQYAKLRDQLWFGLRAWLQGGAIPGDEKLAGELAAPRYGFDAGGKVKVEAKDSIKKRLGRSPDRADALALAVFEAPASSALSRLRRLSAL